MTQFYDKSNPIKRNHLSEDRDYINLFNRSKEAYGFRDLENNAAAQQEMLKLYQHTAEIYSALHPQDPAFDRMCAEELHLRKLCFYMHMADSAQTEKKLVLIISTVKDIDPAIEVCNVYGFGYAPWHPFVMANNRPRGIIIDFSNKDFNDLKVLEAYEYLSLEYLGPKTKRALGNTHFSMEYAGCFFPV